MMGIKYNHSSKAYKNEKKEQLYHDIQKSFGVVDDLQKMIAYELYKQEDRRSFLELNNQETEFEGCEQDDGFKSQGRNNGQHI